MGKIEQITDTDMRFYEVEPGLYYPSMTTVKSSGTPTAPHLVKWWKQNGFMSDFLMEKAGKEGTRVHNAIEDFLNGIELKIEEFQDNIYLWEMVCKFVLFYHKHVEQVHGIEVKSYSHELRLAGMMDLIATLKDGCLWIVDFKTSNYANDDFSVQTYGYKVMAEEQLGYKIEKRGILHLKALTRGPSKTKGKIQGKGWNLVEHKDDEGDHAKIMAARHTFDLYYPNAKPNLRKYPTTLSLGQPFDEEDFTFTYSTDDDDQ